MKINHKNIEEVFFNYYEGNLNENEKSSLFVLLDADASLYKEFTLWKDSYVNEPLPEVTALERSLIRKEQAWFKMDKLIATELFILVGIASFMFWNFHKNVPEIKTTNTTTIEKNLKDEVLQDLKKEEKLDYANKASKFKKRNLESMVENSNSTISFAHDTTSSSLPTIIEIEIESQPTTAEIVILEETKDTIQSTTLQIEQRSVKKLSKKDLRELKKAKLKIIRHRQEQEFLKGDQPYVVPIDPSRF